MSDANLLFTVTSAALLMALVAWVSYQKTKGTVDTAEGYFLAGRGLTGVFIAGSMLLTNLSAEQLIGLNGSAYGFNMSSMAWEVTAGFAIIIMALVFLPRYLAGAFTTLPEFLKNRFDDDVRRMTVVLFLLGYGLITIPSVLYSGSLAVLRLFNVPALTGMSFGESLVVTIVGIGVIGSIYAVFGGLRAVAVSDTINGIGLLIVGLMIPYFGLMALGDGHFFAGVSTIVTENTHKLNAVGSDSDPTPFGTLFTGMIFANLFYWGTNQYVIQRTLGAKSLAEGQKGVMLTGFFKLFVPILMLIPGVIAFHMYGPGLATIDLAYPQLVADVLPVYLSGFFLAVLLGAVFSSFNSLLNSAATLFTLDVYAPLAKKKISDAKLIRIAKIASIVIALLSFVVAPLLARAPEGLWQIIRIFTGFYNIPIIAVVIIGLFAHRVPALGAKIAIVFHVIAYGTLKFIWVVDINFIHIYAILFAIEVAIMLAVGYWRPLSIPAKGKTAPAVDMTPWKYSVPVAIILVAAITAQYIIFSPIGVVGGVGSDFWMAITALLLVTLLATRRALSHWQGKYQHSLAFKLSKDSHPHQERP